jgi:hypothetical protein
VPKPIKTAVSPLNSSVPNPNFGKLTIGVDYHGVLCGYRGGPASRGPEGIALDEPTPGAIEWLLKTSETFQIAVTCATFARPGEDGLNAMRAVAAWLERYGVPRVWIGFDPDRSRRLYLTAGKPACHALIDDRAVPFAGTFPTVEALAAFKPWNR